MVNAAYEPLGNSRLDVSELSRRQLCYVSIADALYAEARIPELYQSIQLAIAPLYDEVEIIPESKICQCNKNSDFIFADSLLHCFSRRNSEKILNSIKGIKIGIGFDDEYLFHDVLYLAQFLNGFVTFDLVTESYLRQINVPVVLCPHPFPSNSVRGFNKNQDFKYDVSFVGTISSEKQNRKKIIDVIKQEYPNSFFPTLHKYHVSKKDMLDIFQKSRINLNFSLISRFDFGFMPPFQYKRNGFKGRPFEIGLAGGFCLSEYSPAIAHFLEDKKHLAYFTGTDQALELIQHYLALPAASCEMRLQLHEYCLNFVDANNKNYFLKYYAYLLSQIKSSKPTDLTGYVNLFSETERLLHLQSESVLNKILNFLVYFYDLTKYCINFLLRSLGFFAFFVKKTVRGILR